MELSVGIMAHNEESNIGQLLRMLLGQKGVEIKEIVVVSSSTDRTNGIVLEQAKHDGRVRLIRERRRQGKASAINTFLKESSCEILVLESADTAPCPGALRSLCKPLDNPTIGIVGGRPVPQNVKGFMGRIIALQWELHHKVALEHPKFGELIAFRRCFDRIEDTAVDEEYIAMRCRNAGLNFAYAPLARVRNNGPTNIRDYITQRRRIFCGHLQVAKEYKHRPATMDNSYVMKKLVSILTIRRILDASMAVLLESYCRILGYLDFILKRDHHIWRISSSTKRVITP